MTDLQ